MPSSTRTSREIRLLHWNIHSWRDEAGNTNVDALAKLIEEMRPHVVSVVEVDEAWSEPNCLEAVAQHCGHTLIFSPAFEYGGDDEPRGGFGNALLTASSGPRPPAVARHHSNAR